MWKIAIERLQFQRDEKTAKAVKGIASCGTIVRRSFQLIENFSVKGITHDWLLLH